LGAMLVKGHKTNIIQGKVKKKKDASWLCRKSMKKKWEKSDYIRLGTLGWFNLDGEW
jgi:hypothetical protein